VISNSPNQIISTSIPFTINTSPVIISCPAPVTSFTTFNLCSAVVTYNAATASGFPSPSIIYSKNSGTSFQTGITNVIATVSNACNTVTCNFNVTVIDNQPPSITCPATVNANASNGQCSANGVSLGSPTVGDNCGVVGFTNNAPSSFPVGNTSVTWTVTDVNGNTNQCVQSVIVNDNQLPVISCPATVNVNAATGLCAASGVVLGTPSVNDNCGIANVANNAPSAFPVGNTVVTWTAIDVNSNAKQCAQTVIVTDNQSPVITGCPANIISRNHGATWIPPVASDNCGIASFSSNYAPGAIFPNGTSTVTYTATDVNGKTSSCSFTVKTNQIKYTIVASGPLELCKPGSIILSAFPPGNFYQWYRNNNPVSGASQINYNAATDGSYFCKVTDDFGSVNSNALTVTTVSTPVATISPSATVTICEGQTAMLNANTGSGLTYQWKKGTANISGATNSRYQTTQPGAYKVIVKNSTGCSKSSAATSVSISCKEDIALNEPININVFPNPNDGNFTVSYTAIGNNSSTIQVANLLGQVVYEKTSKDNSAISFNLTSEPAGIYFIRLKCDDHTVVKKIEVIR
ncbi:MAG: HYR domain-containing protein, partial [Chitinophagales bacterium]